MIAPRNNCSGIKATDTGRCDRGERDARLGAPGGEHHRDPEVPAPDRDRLRVRAPGMEHAAG